MFPVGLLLPDDGLSVEDIVFRAQAIVLIIAAATNRGAACPCCSQLSGRVHSRYWRTLRDLPWADMAVTLRVRVRRFRCTNPSCPQAIFAERFPNLAGVRARRTDRQKEALEYVGFALGGSAGARLAGRIRLGASRSTIIRFVCKAPMPLADIPQVLGVDDWARLKGRRYGTILVDLERHQPIDLLPDRTADSFATWLREHPGVEIISRDRGGIYADGGRKGAPDALQVADRFHLLVNVGEAAERVLSRKHACLKDAAAAVDRLVSETSDTQFEPASPSSTPLTRERVTRHEQVKQAHRARRLERYKTVVALHGQGASARAISRELGISRTTVRRFIGAGSFPEMPDRPKRPGILTPFESHLRERWTSGVHNAHTLWKEIHGQGFSGSKSIVRQFVARWRWTPGRRGPSLKQALSKEGAPTPPKVQPTPVLSPRQAKWLLLRDGDDLDRDELTYRDQLLETSEEIRTAMRLANEFARIVREGDLPALESWLLTAESSHLGEFARFALVLRRDLPAVQASLTYDWSNGQTEGQINRLKMLKRQMYGRASLNLLKRRFLRAA